ncbi:hypothetical protein BGX33_010879 [Mortierella sp. NVP41]|nr:hypothetical protein BGX33_010879 [Mortierella sp. NVP41]
MGHGGGGPILQKTMHKIPISTSRDLYQTFKRFRPDKERIPPTPTITITTRNWRDWLGHKSYYHDYLDFFDQELRQLEADTHAHATSIAMQTPLLTPWSAPSSPSTAETSSLAVAMARLVSEYLTPLIPGLCASTGALIHLGYGVEFGSRLATAEGLAYACISYQPATTCFIPSTAPSSWTQKTATTTTEATTTSAQRRSPTVAILNMIRNDKRLDGMFDAGFQGRLNVVMSSRVSLLKSYLGMWTGQVHSVEEALKDLSQTSSLLLFTATNRFGDQQQMDKHLANVLLATHAARFLINVLPSEVEKEQLLKAIWMSLVATFVVQGRPKLSLSSSSSSSLQHQQQPMMAEVSPQDADEDEEEEVAGYFDSAVPKVPTGRWKTLAQDAIHADHQIVSKIVRSLWWAEREHGLCGGLFYEAAFRTVGDDPTSDESTGPGF